MLPYNTNTSSIEHPLFRLLAQHIRTLPPSTSTLPPGLHHANTSTSTPNLPRYRSPHTHNTSSPNHTQPPTSSCTHDSCSHCAQHCRHNPASDNYNDFSHNNKRHFPQEYRRSQSPNHHRTRSNISRSYSPSPHTNSYSSSSYSTNKYQVRPQKHSNNTKHSSTSTRSHPSPPTNTSRAATNNINKPRMMNANITRYESDNNEIFSNSSYLLI